MGTKGTGARISRSTHIVDMFRQVRGLEVQKQRRERAKVRRVRSVDRGTSALFRQV
jgi:hypothetical protein